MKVTTLQKLWELKVIGLPKNFFAVVSGSLTNISVRAYAVLRFPVSTTVLCNHYSDEIKENLTFLDYKVVYWINTLFRESVLLVSCIFQKKRGIGF